MISKENINEILDATKIEEIIADFVLLKPSGSNLRGLSPFINEKTPSFVVSPSKQIWKDFSSGKGGNVVGFLMEHEHFNYIEALKYLANRYNIKIKNNEKLIFNNNLYKDLKTDIYSIHDTALEFFKNELKNSEEGKNIGINYLYFRNFNDLMIDKFQIGYSQNYKSKFYNFAINKGFTENIIIKSGLCYYNRSNEIIDLFRYRIIFPIFSISGRILGFGGRSLSKNTNIPKYLNSPETEIYQKSKILYGLTQSKQFIIKYNECILLEGYTDVISFYQKEIYNIVAPLGTSLTNEQICLIKRFTKNITIIFDSDPAGINALFRSIDLLLKNSMNIKIVLLPPESDPDSFSKKNTTQDIKNYIKENSINFVQFKIRILYKKYKKDLIKKSEIIEDIIFSISCINNIIKKELYIQETSSILNIPEEILRIQLSRIENNNSNLEKNKSNISISINKEKIYDNVYSIYEDKLIETIFCYGDYIIEPKYFKQNTYKITVIEEIIQQLKNNQIQFKNKFYQNIIDDIDYGLKKGELRNGIFYSKSINKKIMEKASNSLIKKYEISKNWKKKGINIKEKINNLSQFVTDLILRYKLFYIDQKINKISIEIKNQKNINNDNRNLLYKDLLKCIKIKNLILNKELNQIGIPQQKKNSIYHDKLYNL